MAPLSFKDRNSQQNEAEDARIILFRQSSKLRDALGLESPRDV